jgi:hypothetical protein
VTRVGEERIPCRVLVLKPEKKTTNESWVWMGGGIKVYNRMGGRGLGLCEVRYGHVAGLL